MQSKPPENSGDLLRVYQEQLAHKDSQIAALTSLLLEANARLAQQQRITEGVIGAHPTAVVTDLQPPGESPGTPSPSAPDDTHAAPVAAASARAALVDSLTASPTAADPGPAPTPAREAVAVGPMAPVQEASAERPVAVVPSAAAVADAANDPTAPADAQQPIVDESADGGKPEATPLPKTEAPTASRRPGRAHTAATETDSRTGIDPAAEADGHTRLYPAALRDGQRPELDESTDAAATLQGEQRPALSHSSDIAATLHDEQPRALVESTAIASDPVEPMPPELPFEEPPPVEKTSPEAGSAPEAASDAAPASEGASDAAPASEEAPGPVAEPAEPDPAVIGEDDPVLQAAAEQTKQHEGGTALALAEGGEDVAETGHGAIPISYFGPPMTGLAQNLREAAAGRDASELEEIGDPESEWAVAARPGAGRGSGGLRHAPLVAGLVLCAAAIVYGIVWLNTTSAGARHRNALTSVGMLPSKAARASTLPSRDSWPSGGADSAHPAAGAGMPSDASPAANGGPTTAGVTSPAETAAPNTSGPPDDGATARDAAKPPDAGTPPVASASDVTGATGGANAGAPGSAAPGATASGSTVPGSAGPGDQAANAAAAKPSAEDLRLVQAVTRPNLARVRSLLAAGANVNARNIHSSSVLAIAARQGYTSIAERLLKSGADVNSGNDRGWTPLMLAVSYGHLAIARALLRHGARTDLFNSQGTTALMLAAQRGDEDAVNLLLASGAATLARNKEGFTARDLAFRNGHAGVVAVLDKASAITQ